MNGELFGLLANPGGRRAQGFLQACEDMGLPAPRVVPWKAWLTSAEEERRVLLAGLDALRIETPAENDEVERLLLAAGVDDCESEARYPFLSAEACQTLPPDEGELRWQRQWYLGWQSELRQLSEIIAASGLPVMNWPEEIATLFDKATTRDVLKQNGVPIPAGGMLCRDFAHLLEIMESERWSRVFLKPCHGSSASGVMAISRSGARWKVVTSAVLEASNRIKNAKELRQLDSLDEIAPLVDAVCRQRALVERWFSKATLGGRSFDLRVVVIAGEPTHIAVRTSTHPITNLHLRNRRGELEKVISSLGPAKWEAALNVARQAALAFPGCHYVGVDLMIGAGGAGVVVAEVNAFGDLLHHEFWRGMSTWRAELELWFGNQVVYG